MPYRFLLPRIDGVIQKLVEHQRFGDTLEILIFENNEIAKGILRFGSITSMELSQTKTITYGLLMLLNYDFQNIFNSLRASKSQV